MSQNIERKIVIGLISNTEYFKAVRKFIKAELFQSGVAKVLAGWCLEHFDKYREAPGNLIGDIYMKKLQANAISADVGEEIEEEILPGLSDEYVEEGIDLAPLIDYTQQYFEERKLQDLRSELEVLLDKGEVEEAANLVMEFRKTTHVQDELIFDSPNIAAAVNRALTQTYEPLVRFPGALGLFWNDQFVRGAMVGFIAPEKRGKTAMMMDIAKRGTRQGNKVAWFSAGDMTTNQCVRRATISTVGKTDREKYVGPCFVPVRDCVKNQLNLCDKRVRESNYGIFEDRGWDEKMLKESVTMSMLLEAYEADSDYQPCYNCSAYLKNSLGVPWIKKQEVKLLGVREAEKVMENWYCKKNRSFRISTHINGSLSVKGIREVLDSWRLVDNYVPDIVIIDYADLLVPSTKMEFRHQQNQIWKDLRGLNQELDCLLITATQADAASYEVDTLGLGNFSEDKRKYGHVTAMYGLNQDKHGREKAIGLLRINELVLREDAFDVKRCVTVLQDLKLYRAVTGSYF